MSDALNYPLPPEIDEPPMDVDALYAQSNPPTTETPTTPAGGGGD
jgi:hypothetical protein